MSRESRQQKREAESLLRGTGDVWSSGLGEAEKPKHLLDLGDRPAFAPYVPATSHRTYGREERRRLGQMVKRELKDLDEEEKFRGILQRLIDSLPENLRSLRNDTLLVSEGFSKSPMHMRLAEEMGFKIQASEAVPMNHVMLCRKAQEPGDAF